MGICVLSFVFFGKWLLAGRYKEKIKGAISFYCSQPRVFDYLSISLQ
jgi:hypothetical protein